MNSRRLAQAGFTAVELMMALTLFSIGVTGLFAVQAVTARSNTSAKDIATATQLARSWEERLSMDGNLWGGPQDWALANTTWLEVTDSGDNGQWILPAVSGDFGPAAGSRGEPVAAADAYFCTHIRLTSLQDEPYGLIRADVRVFWEVKGATAWSDGDPYCVPAADIVSIGASDTFHFVHAATVVRQTPRF